MVNGKKIRQMRESEELTTGELGEKVFASQSMIVFIENGIKQPGIELLKRIADYFGCTVDELLEQSSA